MPKQFKVTQGLAGLMWSAPSFFIAKALGDIARAQSMTQIAEKTGRSRDKSLSGDRVSGFDTILKVTQTLGVKLHLNV